MCIDILVQTLFLLNSNKTEPVKILSNVSGVLKPVRPFLFTVTKLCEDDRLTLPLRIAV